MCLSEGCEKGGDLTGGKVVIWSPKLDVGIRLKNGRNDRFNANEIKDRILGKQLHTEVEMLGTLRKSENRGQCLVHLTSPLNYSTQRFANNIRDKH